MDRQTAEACIAIAEDVRLQAEKAAEHMTYGELYGKQCKIDAADQIIERIRKAMES